MENYSDYIAKNRESWNKRTDYHLESEFYDVKGFLQGKTSLKSIELNLLGDIKNKSLLHLQCHFGQDTLSLARMGADVTGVDLSDNAIKNAKLLAEKTNLDAKFICCDLYSLPQQLDKQFDIVFTSYGTIGWLPDIDKWAKLISTYLKPGGKFIFVEFHPVVWMYDDNFEKIAYNYFNVAPIVETESGTYADKTAPIKNEYIAWNHPTSEVLNSLIQNGLVLKSFDEFNYSPYNCFNHTEEFEPGKFRIKHLGNNIPMVFSLEAEKEI
ncbi:class I SAM-dependent methyltransferase [Aurantibacillus circumpalustris]|uniref:class I SAM-dependent methyltransferase n=1 Tax=Aurantibacillus circumpalustris TaxID=3036359 RepID=UPI00295A79AF|nr:class I SAM-dependent methyltransferase [Aurantibacillus circumpalustris]